MDKKWSRILIILGLLQLLFDGCMLLMIDRFQNELRFYKKWETIQINSLWENVQNCQNFDAKITDILYNPNRTVNNLSK